MRHALWLALAAINLALHLVVWIIHPSDGVFLACSIALGVIFFLGFFAYIAGEARRRRASIR